VSSIMDIYKLSDTVIIASSYPQKSAVPNMSMIISIGLERASMPSNVLVAKHMCQAK